MSKQIVLVALGMFLVGCIQTQVSAPAPQPTRPAPYGFKATTQENFTPMPPSQAPVAAPYNQDVAAKFMGKWQSTRHTEYLIIENHSTYAVARFCGITTTDPACNHPLWTQSPLLTQDGKLINSFTRSDGREVDEFVILGNGHLLWMYTVFYPDGTQKSFLGSEFVH